MSVNLDGLSSKELAELIARANQRKKVLAKRKPAAQVKAAIARVLKDGGWTFEELYGATGAAKPLVAAPTAPKTTRRSTKGRKLGKVAPKYRNPANPKDTWAGRGQQPKWLAAETAKGRALDDFLIR
jgi:DNA-binding protein H-NS